MSDPVYVIFFEKGDYIHKIYETKKLAQIYCRENRHFYWEAYGVQEK